MLTDRSGEAYGTEAAGDTLREEAAGDISGSEVAARNRSSLRIMQQHSGPDE